MEDYKSETVRAYNQFADDFGDKFQSHFNEVAAGFAAAFLTSNLPGNRILDAGPGPGDHAAYFASGEWKVTCIDLSPQMVTLCRAKGLDAKVMDLEKLAFQPDSFDGIWAYTSLLHLPKAKIPDVVQNLRKLLVKNGVLGIAMLQGAGEGFKQDERYPDTRRWFSYVNPADLDALMGRGFERVLLGNKNVTGKNGRLVFLHSLYRKT